MALLGGAVVALPRAAPAQQPAKVHRIGLLRVGPPPRSFIEPFRDGLRELGFVEDQNIVVEYAVGRSVEQLPDIAADLVRRKVDVIVASGTPAVLPARNATRTIPVVFVAAIDPVAIGLVTSLARPGGNITGMTSVFADLVGKRLELLKEAFPALARVVLLSRVDNPGHVQYVREAQRAARILGLQLQVVTVVGPDELEAAFRSAEGAGAIVPIDDAMFTSHRQVLVALAISHRLPAVYGVREFVEIGGLMALGASFSDLYRRAAGYVGKILKGTSPADLPIQQPTQFELSVNVRTAKALGLKIPPLLLSRADAVIE
jgi:putative ABC transport system substrate-binding protein